MSNDLVTLSLESLAKKYEAQARQLGYAKNPEAWIEDILHAFLWSAQKEVIASVVANRYTAVQAGHGVGKSYLAAALTAWWLLNHERGKTRVVTTAPTAAQIQQVIWMEIKRVWRTLKEQDLHEGTYITAGNQPEWKTLGGQDTIAIGRKPADHDDNGFQGLHDKFLLVIIDEACGIVKGLWDGVDSVATGRENRVVAFGNPTDPQSHFQTVCKKLADWNTIRIDLLRSPNMTQEACDRLPDLAQAMREAGIRPSTEYVPPHVAEVISSAEYVAERYRMWGPTSALWISKVRAEFPDDSTEGVIPLAWIEAAQRRWIEWDEAGRPPLPGTTAISCDVSGNGSDATTIGVRTGPCLTSFDYHPGMDDTTKIYKRLLVADGPGTMSIPGLEFIVDANGIGTGVYDRLVEHMDEMKRPLTPPVHAFVSQRSAPGLTDDAHFGFDNLRSWSWWKLRTMLTPYQPGGSRLMLPPDERLTTDLQTPKYTTTETGLPPRIKVESKKDIFKRLKRSTDMGDMCTMAFSLTTPPTPDPAHDRVWEWGEEQPLSNRTWNDLGPYWGLERDNGGSVFGDEGGFANGFE